MTDSNTPVPDAAVLPIVAWLHELTTESYRESSITSFSETDPWVDALKDIGHAVLSRPLTPQAPAQAQINSLRDELSGAYELLHRTEDEKMSLRDEVERLKREAQERALQYLSDNGQWLEEVARLTKERDEALADTKEIRARWNDAENEFAALAPQGDDVRDARWQPIETAPRDSRKILVAVADAPDDRQKVREAWWRIPFEGAAHEHCYWCYDGKGTMLDRSVHGIGATHWMPLPDAPDAAMATKEAR